MRFKEKLGTAFIDRIESRIGKDFDDAVKTDPKELLQKIVEDVHLYYVLPFEMILEIGEYLDDKHKINRFHLALSPEYTFSPTEKLKEIREFVSDFYDMIEELKLSQQFLRKGEKWWKR